MPSLCVGGGGVCVCGLRWHLFVWVAVGLCVGVTVACVCVGVGGGGVCVCGWR